MAECLACVDAAEAEGVDEAAAGVLVVATGDGVLLGVGAALAITLGGVVVEAVEALGVDTAAGVAASAAVVAVAVAPGLAAAAASSAAIRVLYSRGVSISPVGVATPFRPSPPDHIPRFLAFALASATRYCASRPPNSAPVLAS